jgi:hypothetical protein
VSSANKYVLDYESVPISDLGSSPSLTWMPPDSGQQGEKDMSDLNRQQEIRGNQASPIPGLDAQLVELIEFIWVCEAAARRDDRIDSAIKYGSKRSTS